MRKTVRKVFCAWEFDKEEKWLNDMAAKGLALTSVGFCRYEFEDCVPGEYKFSLEFLDGRTSSAENVKYIEFLEEAGMKHVGTYGRWVYFRGRTYNYRLFSDNTSKVKHLTRIIRFITFLWVFNLCCGFYNLFLFFRLHNPISLVCIISFAITFFVAIGIVRLLKKRKRLKNENRIFE